MKIHTISLLFLLLGLTGLAVQAESKQPLPRVPVSDENIEIKIHQVAKNIYMFEGLGGNIGVFVGEDGVFIVDDQFAVLTKKIVNAIRTISDKEIRFLVNTHHHGDHVGGNENFARAGTLLLAHDNTRRRLVKGVKSVIRNSPIQNYPDNALPVVTYTEQISFYLNGERVNVIHLPAAHTDNDSIVHFTESDVIHTGDVFRTTYYPIVDIYYGGKLDGIINAHKVLIELAGPDTKIIPGHGVVTNKELLIQSRTMLITIRDRIKKLVKEGKNLEEIIAENPTAEFDARWDAERDVIGKKGFIERYYRELTGDFQIQ